MAHDDPQWMSSGSRISDLNPKRAEINGHGPHTYHPASFGLLYGRRTRTACGKRVATSRLVAPLETTCPGCQDALLESMYCSQEMYAAALELSRQEGYPSLAKAAEAHRARHT